MGNSRPKTADWAPGTLDRTRKAIGNIDEAEAVHEDTKKSKSSIISERISEANLNPKYTFDTFVVGGSNSFAHAYALKVAESLNSLARVGWSIFL